VAEISKSHAAMICVCVNDADVEASRSIGRLFISQAHVKHIMSEIVSIMAMSIPNLWQETGVL
jgi:hypothetical protein